MENCGDVRATLAVRPKVETKLPVVQEQELSLAGRRDNQG